MASRFKKNASWKKRTEKKNYVIEIELKSETEAEHVNFLKRTDTIYLPELPIEFVPNPTLLNGIDKST